MIWEAQLNPSPGDLGNHLEELHTVSQEMNLFMYKRLFTLFHIRVNVLADFKRHPVLSKMAAIETETQIEDSKLSMKHI